MVYESYRFSFNFFKPSQYFKVKGFHRAALLFNEVIKMGKREQLDWYLLLTRPHRSLLANYRYTMKNIS